MIKLHSKFNLGDKVQDKITGFVGRVIAISFWLNGCVQCGVKAPIDKDGKIREAEWFDDQQLTLAAPTSAKPKIGPLTGGPQHDAPRC